MHLRRKGFLVVLLALVVAVSAFVIVRLSRGPHDLKSALAAALRLPPEQAADFFVNLPPAASRYPGAVLVVPKMLVLEQSTANDDGLATGEQFSLDASDSTLADAVASFRSDPLSTAAHDKDNVELRLEVKEGHVIEMPVSLLKKKLLDSDAAKSAANHGTDPIVITRSYVGTLIFVLRQKSAAGGQLLAKVAKSSDLPSNGSVSVDANRVGEGILRITVQNPVVFAFEASSAQYITQHLGTVPDDVTLKPVRPESISKNSSEAAPTSNAVSWTLATISSGYYSNLRTLNQSWNANSADLMESALTKFGPTQRLQLRASQEKPLTEFRLEKFVDEIDGTAHATHSSFIIVYYVGHTLSWPNRDIALLLGDAEAIPETTHREVSNRDIHRAMGDKVGSLFDLSDALQANLEQLPTGFMPVRDLYAKLEKTGVPFVILIDGCLRNDEFEAFRNELGLASDAGTHFFFYVGPDGKLFSSLDEFDRGLRHFADTLPYLHSMNVVILAAKPGTFAQPWTNPQLSWEYSGPLAARLFHYMQAAAFDPEYPSLGEALSNITEYKGTGEISPKGSISWSDFSQLKEITGAVKPKLL